MDALASKSPDATLRLRREHSRWADRARMYQVVLDDVIIGDIRNGESQTFQISPGSHRLRLKVDWVGSPEARFHVETGQSAVVMGPPWPSIRSLVGGSPPKLRIGRGVGC